MKATFELLQALLQRGWTVEGYETLAPNGRYEQVMRYRTPKGISGSDYQSHSGGYGLPLLDEFPPAVEVWIWKNILMQADVENAKHGTH